MKRKREDEDDGDLYGNKNIAETTSAEPSNDQDKNPESQGKQTEEKEWILFLVSSKGSLQVQPYVLFANHRFDECWISA